MENWRKRIKPFPERFRALKFRVPPTLTNLDDDWLPESMDDKWVGILGENSVDLYRSWSGTHVYRIELQLGENDMRCRLMVNADPNQINRLYVWLAPHRWLVRHLISYWHADLTNGAMTE